MVQVWCESQRPRQLKSLCLLAMILNYSRLNIFYVNWQNKLSYAFVINICMMRAEFFPYGTRAPLHHVKQYWAPRQNDDWYSKMTFLRKIIAAFIFGQREYIGNAGTVVLFTFLKLETSPLLRRPNNDNILICDFRNIWLHDTTREYSRVVVVIAICFSVTTMSVNQ
jgi:hypothetical protein